MSTKPKKKRNKVATDFLTTVRRMIEGEPERGVFHTLAGEAELADMPALVRAVLAHKDANAVFDTLCIARVLWAFAEEAVHQLHENLLAHPHSCRAQRFLPTLGECAEKHLRDNTYYNQSSHVLVRLLRDGHLQVLPCPKPRRDSSAFMGPPLRGERPGRSGPAVPDPHSLPTPEKKNS